VGLDHAKSSTRGASTQIANQSARAGTTEQAKLEEEQLLDLVRGGWDTCKPIGRPFELDLAKLTDEQRMALEHILARQGTW
jgi:hypothetical protein